MFGSRKLGEKDIRDRKLVAMKKIHVSKATESETPIF